MYDLLVVLVRVQTLVLGVFHCRAFFVTPDGEKWCHTIFLCSIVTISAFTFFISEISMRSFRGRKPTRRHMFLPELLFWLLCEGQLGQD